MSKNPRVTLALYTLLLFLSISMLTQNKAIADKDNASSKNDILSMSSDELAEVPPGDLSVELSKLKARNNADQKSLTNLRSTNLALCQRFERLRKECPAYRYITTDYYIDDLACTNENEQDEDKKTKIHVQIDGGIDGYTFVLEIDSKYRSTEFTGTGQDISFHHVDNKTIIPPMFLEIGELSIRSIVPKTSDKAQPITKPMPPLNSFSIRISVNGYPLMNDFTMVNPLNFKANSATDTPSYYRINPNGIANLGTASNASACEVTLLDIQTIQKNAKIQK